MPTRYRERDRVAPAPALPSAKAVWPHASIATGRTACASDPTPAGLALTPADGMRALRLHQAVCLGRQFRDAV
jgi:hypothetical protein